jgi:succinate dehydrogenase/fumarate reductase flavoprotein subunit
MNPLSIELYRRYKIDIAREPREFAVNDQHMYGGVAVDIWGRSSNPAIYAVGEAAGTHGVTRPGARGSTQARSSGRARRSMSRCPGWRPPKPEPPP